MGVARVAQAGQVATGVQVFCPTCRGDAIAPARVGIWPRPQTSEAQARKRFRGGPEKASAQPGVWCGVGVQAKTRMPSVPAMPSRLGKGGAAPQQ
jgi:hypothetical protein